MLFIQTNAEKMNNKFKSFVLCVVEFICFQILSALVGRYEKPIAKVLKTSLCKEIFEGI
jgi:hypothetical protein